MFKIDIFYRKTDLSVTDKFKLSPDSYLRPDWYVESLEDVCVILKNLPRSYYVTLSEIKTSSVEDVLNNFLSKEL